MITDSAAEAALRTSVMKEPCLYVDLLFLSLQLKNVKYHVVLHYHSSPQDRGQRQVIDYCTAPNELVLSCISH